MYMKKILLSALLAVSLCACTKETINYLNPAIGGVRTTVK